MGRLAKLSTFILGLFILCVSWADAEKVAYSPPPGLDPDEDSLARQKYQKAVPSWHPSFLLPMRKHFLKWNKIAPIHFYRRTCGNGEPARQIIARIGQFDLGSILKDDATQTEFLLYIRWLIEAYWRRVVPMYRFEPKPVFILDFDGIGWRTAISNMLGITSLVKKMNSAFFGVTGKGWKATYILNPPSCFDTIWGAVTKFVTFRNEGVVVVNDETRHRQFLEDTGNKCLWVGFGGKSKLPLGKGVVEDAFLKFSRADDSNLEDMDFVRLTPQAENFPAPEVVGKSNE